MCLNETTKAFIICALSCTYIAKSVLESFLCAYFLFKGRKAFFAYWPSTYEKNDCVMSVNYWWIVRIEKLQNLPRTFPLRVFNNSFKKTLWFWFCKYLLPLYGFPSAVYLVVEILFRYQIPSLSFVIFYTFSFITL